MIEGYSISKAISELINRGIPTSKIEAEFHFSTVRTSEKSGFSRQLGWPGKGLIAPLRGLASRQLTIATSGWTGRQPIEDLGVLRWSAVAQAGAMVLGPLREHINVWHTSELPPAEWLQEIGQVTPSDPTIQASELYPCRIAAQVIFSRQLFLQASNAVDAYVEREIGRSLSARLDQACLYGTGPNFFQPLGVLNTPNVNAIAFPAAAVGSSWIGLNEMRVSCLDHDVYPDSYGLISSPFNESKLLLDVPFAGSAPTVWHSIPDPKFFSRQVTDNRFFSGCWAYLVVGLWGGNDTEPGFDLVVDAVTRGGSGRIAVTASLWCNCAVRWPEVFAFSQVDPLPLASSAATKKKAA
jgi:hypothetical protein